MLCVEKKTDTRYFKKTKKKNNKDKVKIKKKKGMFHFLLVICKK